MTERPLCECHGYPMHRRNDRPKNPWRCGVQRIAHQTRYAKTEKGRAIHKSVNARRVYFGRTVIGYLPKELEGEMPRLRKMVQDFYRKQAEERKVHESLA